VVLRVDLGANERHDHAVRRVLVVLAALVLDHLALALEGLLIGVIEEIRHAIALEPQGELELVCGNGLEVVGAVGVGGAVDRRRAGLLEEAEVAVFGHVLAALEHDVLEEVREPVAVLGLVLRADVIPEVRRHDGRAVILVEDHLEPVRQRGGRRVHRHRQRRRGRRIRGDVERREQHTEHEGSEEREGEEGASHASADYCVRAWVRPPYSASRFRRATVEPWPRPP
jgi:hypothetical protein